MVTASGGTWARYGASAGSLILGGAVAIVAVVATIVRVPRWTATDLISCLCFSGFLIVIGITSGLVGRHIQIRSFESQVKAYGHYKDGVTEIARELAEKLPSSPLGPTSP